MPLALAVGFAMVASYVLSSTFVPVISVWLIKHHGHQHAERSKPGLFDRFQIIFGGWVRRLVQLALDCRAGLSRRVRAGAW